MRLDSVSWAQAVRSDTGDQRHSTGAAATTGEGRAAVRVLIDTDSCARCPLSRAALYLRAYGQTVAPVRASISVMALVVARPAPPISSAYVALVSVVLPVVIVSLLVL